MATKRVAIGTGRMGQPCKPTKETGIRPMLRGVAIQAREVERRRERGRGVGSVEEVPSALLFHPASPIPR